MDELFRIGEVSKLFHISMSSLRHYENIGLLKPEKIDPENGYRYYGASQFEVLNTLRYLRALDMPLNEIAEFVQNRDVDSIEEKLIKQKDLIAQKRLVLERIERKIDTRLRQLDDAMHSQLDVISLKTCAPLRIFWMQQSIQIHAYADMETPVRNLQANFSEAAVFLGKIGVSISQDNLTSGQFDRYDGVFLIADAEDELEGTIWPETTCATLRFRGSHTEAPMQYAKLTQYIQDHHFSIAGCSREITMIDYGITNDPEKFVTEISIPVTQTK